MNLTQLARQYEDKIAVVMGTSGKSLTYRQLEEQSNAIAHLFRLRGLAAGDHIAILMENEIDVFPVVWAAQRSGLLYTPVNWHLSADEAAYIVENCGAQLLVHSESLRDLAVYSESTAPLVKSRLSVRSDSEDSLEAAIDGLPVTPISDETEGYYMLYSSGTTGRPKGILPELTGQPFGAGLSIDSLMASAFGFGPEAVYLSPGPLYHAAPLGWCLGTVRNGGTAVVMEKFDAERTLGLIERFEVTHGQFVPTMFVRMLKLDDATRARYDVSSMKLVVHAAAPCSIEVKERMIEWFGPKLTEFYSGSEGTGFFMIDSPNWLTHKGSVGQAIRGVVHICDDDGIELPAGEIGSVWFSDIGRFEYHGEPAKTAESFNDKGWNTLGDLGHVDQDGYLYLSARRSDLILSGGVNIYPQEIEDALAMHPAVSDVAVIGLPDDEMGQKVHAVIAPASGVIADDALAAEIIKYCRAHIAGYKTPRSVTFGDVPRLPSGKILRRELIADFENQTAQ
ncbi:acyl-CoA synthetase (plasmid) [Rhodococcus sp. BH4]|uniref:acyl-CoA synthetase n=1 Tax=Rhodococcus sp. BH4 TaxID=1807790 RepID=UPI0009C335BC|nr:acyl-CoA synthetase [Rhodococcus sp. BH4]ARE37784.1 acyl-CoA synthetase [Rhodococcus sp. BH4]